MTGPPNDGDPRRIEGHQETATKQSQSESMAGAKDDTAQADFDSYLATMVDSVKTVGAETALGSAGIDWRDRAEIVLDDLIESGVVFTAEDVTDVTGMPDSPNAVGGLLLKASKRGRIRPVGITTSKRLQRHGGTLRTWEGI